MASPRLVAFAGRAGSGKSEAANILLDDLHWTRVKFADILKSMLRAYYEMCGLDADEIDERLEGDLKETPDPFLNGRTPRHAMQTIGGEWGRDLMDEKLWVSAWKRRVQLKLRAGYSVVVDDLRYQNEADAIRELGGEIIMLEGFNSRPLSDHASELMDFDPDVVVRNDSTIRDLRLNILKYLYRD